MKSRNLNKIISEKKNDYQEVFLHEVCKTIAVVRAFLTDVTDSHDIQLAQYLAASTQDRRRASRFVVRFCIPCLHHLKWCSRHWVRTPVRFHAPVPIDCMGMRNFFLIQMRCDTMTLRDYSVPRQINVCLCM